MKWIFAFAFMIMPTAPLLAQSDGLTDAQIIQGGKLPDGRALAALVLTLAPDWKTYWRSPGEGGLPPEYDWTASKNLADIALLWPNPQVFDLGGMVNIGYQDKLVLPLAISPADPSQPVQLNLNMTLGLCKDICTPAQLSLAAVVTGQAPDQAIIVAALASSPLPPAQVGVRGWTCRDTAIKDGQRLHMTLDMPKWAGAEVETVVVEHRDPKVWASAALVTRVGEILKLEVDLVPPNAKPFVLDGADLRFTILAGGTVADLQGCPQR